MDIRGRERSVSIRSYVQQELFLARTCVCVAGIHRCCRSSIYRYTGAANNDRPRLCAEIKNMVCDVAPGAC